jgi:DNA helicase II / ATP-dependent DNA helicase PcrA
MENEVHLFQDDDGWVVAVGESVLRCQDRGTAFRQARDLARRHAPSVMVTSAPENWRSDESPASSAARPGVEVPSPALGQWERLAGPSSLGRSLLISRQGFVPEPWRNCERVNLSQSLLNSQEFLDKVRTCYLSRRPMIYEIPSELGEPEPATVTCDVWRVAVNHDFVAEDIWDLVTRNAIDHRDSKPSWALGELAVDLGATDGGNADVVLPGGQLAWCDGGPLRLWSVEDVRSLGAAVIPREALESGLQTQVVADSPAADLAPDQLEAVADPEIRARIIAPAGSGKTRVLTERARHLLRSGVPASALLLVAFNKRAQEEMLERTRDLPELQVQTLNALGLSILNGTRGFTHRSDPVRTITENEVRDLLSEMIKFPRRTNTDPAAAWVDALSAARLGLQSPESVEAEFNGDVDGFAEFFPRYRRELRRKQQVDFDEQIYGAIEVLLQEPDVRRQARRRAQVLLVDEFQDLTPAHMLMLRLLAGPSLGIFGVGDDDQTIYGYSGASPEWLVSFDQYIPLAGHHELTINYRCPVPVINAARNLLSRNQFRVSKEMRPGPSNVSADSAMEIVEHPIPVLATVDLIKVQIAAGALPSDIAVLTRVNTLLAPVQAALRAEGIPFQNRDSTRFLDRTGVAAALAWMRLAVTQDRLAGGDIMRAAHRPARGISPRVIEWMGEQRDVAGLERLAGRISDERSAGKVEAFARDLERVRHLSKRASSAVILEFIRTETGLDRSMQTLDAAHHGRNSAAHSDDLRALVALGHLQAEAATFDRWVGDILRKEDSGDGVTLATVHKVKGLEWPHVIVYDATSGIFPHRLSTDIEEERRVFHVAITRAQRTLRVVADGMNPSIFLQEVVAERQPAPRTAPPAVSRRHSTSEQNSRSGQRSTPARVGLVLSWGGYECTVSSIVDAAAVVSVGSSTMTIPFGSDVTIDGRMTRLSGPVKGSARAPLGVSSEADPAVISALKAWRLERSKQDGVPAYVVFPNTTLEAIALAMPTTERELVAVPGMGPRRVELYGDEVIAAVDGARTST